VPGAPASALRIGVSVAGARVGGVGVPAVALVAGTPRRLPHGSVVVRQGDVATCLFLVTEGAVRLSSVTPAGREVVVALLGPGDVFGEAALLGAASPIEARAMGPSEVVALSLPALREVIDRHAATAEQMLRLVADRLHRTSRALEEALVGDVTTRVSRRLRELAESHGVRSADGVRIRFPLTQEELARMVGASREAVNRTLVALAARGLVRSRDRTVVIVDPAALPTDRDEPPALSGVGGPTPLEPPRRAP
jgi:CRP/FNR family transcriptional regulator